MLKKLSGFLLLLIILQSCGNSPKFNKPKLDSFFVALNTHHQNMGTIAISHNGELVYQNAIGYSRVNKDSKTPATVNTRYRIGSISKMFTATMIFQLIDEGKLSLYTPLAKYFPQIPNSAKITIGEMLGHRSGLHNFTSDPVFFSYMTTPKSEAEMVAIIGSYKPDFDPDAKAEYSNSNCVLMGYIIEKLTGKTYAKALKQRVALKIGLTATYYGGKIRPEKGEACSYNYPGQWAQMPETDMSIPGGAGGIVSTATDLVKFIEALFAGKLISPVSLTQMTTIRDYYGMGIFPMPFHDKKGYGHTGHIDGFSSLLTYFPQDKLAIAYISNGIRYSTQDVGLAALNIYFNKPFAIPAFKTIASDPATLDQYIGKYSSTHTPLKITITKHDTLLFAQAVGQNAVPLEAKGDNKFVYMTDGVTLIFDPNKSNFSLVQGGKTYLFTKTQ